MVTPTLNWDWGTGYDFFVSLHVLHNADTFGLRSSWAAGVRSRLAETDRHFLEEVQEVISFPLQWIYNLPEPKDSEAVFTNLRHLAPRDRLPTLAQGMNTPQAALSLLKRVADRGSWSPEDVAVLKKTYQESNASSRKKDYECLLEWWSKPGIFGERYLQSLQAYYDVFFAEEEKRIEPRLREALLDAQQKAEDLPFDQLIETLSRGLRFGMELEIGELVLVPSYWITPLIVYRQLSDQKGLFLFGGRAETDSLVPGDQVPDAMLQSLKTLADPTRLRILRYLSEETMAPSELAKRLRLRASTVTHHLNALRLAGLVYLTLEDKHKKLYATRDEAILKTFSSLQSFIRENNQNRKGKGQDET
ncbi:MAG: winged helix-turn-helix domain-containing protein [Anaerolineales bacterium]